MRTTLHEFIRRAEFLLRWPGTVNYGRVCLNVVSFLCSQRYRAALAREYVARRIENWRNRGQLRDDEAARLRDHLTSEESGSYITDFGLHVAIKPMVKFLAYVGIPSLVVLGVLGTSWIPITIIFGGAVARTCYTGGRFIQAVLRRREKPWIALGIGLFPVIGNLAYPLQIVHDGTSRAHQLAQFILYDTFSQLGQNVPIWGGRDTLTEHILNRIPYWMSSRTAPDVAVR